MDMKEKLAVLKLAGYEFPKSDFGWDWELYVDGGFKDCSDTYFRAKFEAVNAAFDHLVSNTSNTLKEVIA